MRSASSKELLLARTLFRWTRLASVAVLLWLGGAIVVGAADNRDEKTVVLRATITVSNTGGLPLKRYTQRLSIPAEDHLQQSLLRIDYPYPEQYRVSRHKNGVDKYLVFEWEVPARASLSREISFVVKVHPFDFRNQTIAGPPSGPGAFLGPSRYVESDSPEIQAIARDIERRYASPLERLQAAYRYPQERLRYTRMPNRGALYALENGRGDCTEYAAIFVALARAMGFPARLTSEFNFADSSRFDQPNHHAAEVLLNGQWLPVDPNLALEPGLGYGFGKGAASKVILKRGDSWTWANHIADVPASYRRKNVDVRIGWDIQRSN